MFILLFKKQLGKGGGRGGGDVDNKPRVAKVVPDMPVVPVGCRAGAAVRHGDPALVASDAFESLRTSGTNRIHKRATVLVAGSASRQG